MFMQRHVRRSVCESPANVRTSSAKGLSDGCGRIRRADEMQPQVCVAKMRKEPTCVWRMAGLQRRVRGNRRTQSRNDFAGNEPCCNVCKSSRRQRAKSLGKFPYTAELFSSAAAVRCDGAKTVVAKVDVAKTGPDHSDSGAAQMVKAGSDRSESDAAPMAKAGAGHFETGAVQLRIRCANVKRAGETVNAISRRRGRQARPGSSRRLARTWTQTEQRSAWMGWCSRRDKSSARRRFSICGLARIAGTGKMDQKATDQKHRNPSGQVVAHGSTELCSARNVRGCEEPRWQPGKPVDVEAGIAIHNLRCRQIAPLRRRELRAAAHRHSAEATGLERAPRCGPKAVRDRMGAVPSDLRRNRVRGGTRLPSARSSLRFGPQSIHRAPHGIPYGDLQCD